MFRYVVGLLVFLLVQIFSVECRILTTLLPSLEVTDFIHGSSKSNENEDPVPPVGTRWALLLAGSNGYENYRHQADICHAYQILKKGGLKDENIVVFMYDDMYAKDLNDVLKKKHELGTYKTLVFYLEACESGSIFEGLLPEDLNIIYATTASNSIESSWGTYCPGGYPGSTPEYDTCLGDLYIITWLEDSDTHNLQRETLEQQYEVGDAGTSQLPPAGPPQHSGGLLYRPVGPQTPPRASDHDHRLVIWVIVVVVVIAVVVAAVVATMVVAAVRWWRRRRATPAALEIEMPALPSYQRVLRQIGQDY